MPEVEAVLYGYGARCDQTSMGLATCTLIRGKYNILVDVGHMGRRTLLLPALEKRGLLPKDIDMVVLTHAHWDHAQNMDLFPNAHFFIHPKELEYTQSVRTDDLFTPRNFINMMAPYKIEEVTDDMEIEPGVRLIDTPGHTRGHISVLIDTSSGIVAASGDALPDAFSAHDLSPFLICWSVKESRRSIERLLESAELFYPGHDQPFRWIANKKEAEYTGEVSSTLNFFSYGDAKGHPGYRVQMDSHPTRPVRILSEAND